MKATKMLNEIKTLLNIEVKLEEMKLENGTVITTDALEKGNEVFIVTDDEKVAMPVGEYILEDGRLLIVEEEGIIADVRDVSDGVPAKEEETTEDLEEETIETEVPEEVASEVEAIVEAVVEVIAPVIEEVKSEVEELKKQYASLMDDKEEKVEDKKKEDLSAARKPITRNSQPKSNKTKVEFGSGKFATTLDRVLNKLNK